MTTTMMRPRRCPRCTTEPRPQLFYESDSVGGGDWCCVSGHRFPVNAPLPYVKGNNGPIFGGRHA